MSNSSNKNDPTNQVEEEKVTQIEAQLSITDSQSSSVSENEKHRSNKEGQGTEPPSVETRSRRSDPMKSKMYQKKPKTDEMGIDPGVLLEYRMKRLVFYMGYYSRTDVNIKTSYDDSSHQITDLDVYGIYIHKDFSRKTIWVDCKSGREGRPHDRIMWIKGVQSVIKPDSIIFVKNGVRQESKQYARKNGIQVLDGRLVDKLENDFGISPSDWRGSWNYQIQLKCKSKFTRLTVPTNDIYRKINSFISDDYWAYDNYSQIKKTMTALRELAPIITLTLPDDELTAVKWAIYELVILFTLSLFGIVKEVYYFSTPEIEGTIFNSLVSSDIPIKKRLQIVNATLRMAYTKMKQQNPDLVIPPTEELIVQYLPEPVYFEALLDLVRRVTTKPNDYFDVMRAFDFLLMEFDLNSKNVDWTTMENHFTGIQGKIHAMKTILHFICSQTGVPKDIFSLLRQ